MSAMKVYNVEAAISRQSDGLWRAEVPGMAGCFVDAASLNQALSELSEVAATILDLRLEDGAALPRSVTPATASKLSARIPVSVEEHQIRRPVWRPRSPTAI